LREDLAATGIAHPIHILAAPSNREIDAGGELGREVPRAPVDAVLYLDIGRRQISFIWIKRWGNANALVGRFG
jgi:hypothetical protein